MTGDLTVPGDLTLGGDIVGLEPQDYVPVFVAGANVVTVPVAVSAQYSRVGSEVRVNIVLGQTELSGIGIGLDVDFTVTVPVARTAVGDAAIGTCNLSQGTNCNMGRVYGHPVSTATVICNLSAGKAFTDTTPDAGHVQFSYYV